MKYKLSGIKIPVSLPDQTRLLEKRVRKKIPSNIEVEAIRIVKKSIDARKKHDIQYLYNVEIVVKKPLKNYQKYGLEWVSFLPDSVLVPGGVILPFRPVICGFGPAGIFAALTLAEYGYQPVVLERGKSIEQRNKDVIRFWKEGILDPESNVQFGEGGAGTFSDGKLTTQTKNPRIKKILEIFVKHGAPEDILFESKPHIGTDLLRKVIVSIRNKIIDLGGQILFESKLEDIQADQSGQIRQITVNGKDIETNVLILAPGHSARDLFEMLCQRNVALEKKPFSAGLRIEHLQEDLNKAQYGEFAEYLGAADYKLSFQGINKSLYTFCMCPGGLVINSASELHTVVTNGMSYHSRNGKNANSAILVNVNPEELDPDVLAGIRWQRELERSAFAAAGSNYSAPVQLVGDFLNKKKTQSLGRVYPTITPGFSFVDFNKLLPDILLEPMHQGLHEFARKLRSFADQDAVLTGVETRSSSPVRIVRANGESVNLKGLFPAGEGAGYAGGIMSAAVDGMVSAETVIKKYRYNGG